MTQALVAELAKLPGMDALAALAGAAPARSRQVRHRHPLDRGGGQGSAPHQGQSRWSSPGAGSPPRCTRWPTPSTRPWATSAPPSRFRAPVRHDPLAGVEPRCRRWSSEIAAGAVDTLVITARNPVYGAPADFKLDKLLRAGARRPSTSACTRTRPPRVAGTFVPAAHSAGVLGRRPRGRRHGVHRPAAHRTRCGAAGDRGRAAGARSWARATAARTSCCGTFWQRRARQRGPGHRRRLRRHLGELAGQGASSRRPRSRPRSAGRIDARRAGGRAGAAARPARPQAPAGSSWPSPSTPRSSTAASPTTPGCRSCPHPITKITWDNAVLLVPGHRRSGLGVEDRRHGPPGDRRPQASAARSTSSPATPTTPSPSSLGYGRKGGRGHRARRRLQRRPAAHQRRALVRAGRAA